MSLFFKAHVCKIIITLPKHNYSKEVLKYFEFLVQPKEEQTELEMRHRKEEDILYQKFAKARADEEARINAEFREEWERELDKLASKFESLRMKEDAHTISRLRAKEKEDLERHFTIRRDKRREQTTRKLLEHERFVTSIQMFI